MKLYFLFFPEEINIKYDLPFKLKPKIIKNEIFEPLREKLETIIEDLIVLETTVNNERGIDYSFVKYGDSYFIKNKSEFKTISKTGETRINNALFKKI